MLVALAVWLAVIPAAWGYGNLTLGTDGPQSVESTLHRVYAGLLTIAALLLAISFVHSLAWWIGFCVVVPGMTAAIANPAARKYQPSVILAALLAAPVALWVAVREVSFYDTALYHQPTVKWLSDYGLVRGLGLICFRFALVSSWFAAAGPVNHGDLEGRASAIVGGIPVVLMIVPTLLLCRNLANKRTVDLRSVTWITFCFALAAISLLTNLGNSLSPDMMAWLAPGFVLLILTDTNGSEHERVGRALVIAALAFLVKVSVAPALAWCLALTAHHFARSRTGRGKLLAYTAVSGLFIALYMSANTIASGCPVFPSPFGCLNLAWSVGREFAGRNLAEINAYNFSGRYSGQMRMLLTPALVSSILLVVFRWRSSFVRKGLAVSWLGIAFVLSVAPVPRYGMAYFLLPVAIGCGAVAESISIWLLKVGRKTAVPTDSGAIAAGFLILLAGAGISACLFLPDAGDHLLLPIRMADSNGDMVHVSNQTMNFRRPLSLRKKSFGDIDIWVPAVGDQCWDAPLPCSAHVSAPRLALRHPEDGFRGGFARISTDFK